jgi:hypothetical protein
MFDANTRVARGPRIPRGLAEFGSRGGGWLPVTAKRGVPPIDPSRCTCIDTRSEPRYISAKCTCRCTQLGEVIV